VPVDPVDPLVVEVDWVEVPEEAEGFEYVWEEVPELLVVVPAELVPDEAGVELVSVDVPDVLEVPEVPEVLWVELA